jgi:hypothetical protein
LVGLIGVIGLMTLGPTLAELLYRNVPADLPPLLALMGLAATVQALVGFLSWTSLGRGEALRPWALGVSGGLAAEAVSIAAWHSSSAIALSTLLGASVALVAGAGLRGVDHLRQAASHESPATSLRLFSSQAGNPVGPLDHVPVSVGVLAHNEREMIVMAVNGFLAQLHSRIFVDEVIVIVSGSTDGTPEAVETVVARDARVRLVIQPERLGKLHAVMEFFELARNDLCVESSGDVVPEPDLVERLCRPMLDDPEVGMVGPQVASERLSYSFVSRMHQVLWHLHEYVAAQSPKIGEAYAVRKGLVGELAPVAGCDEVLVEAAVRRSGGQLAYARDAVVHNVAPTSLAEYFETRRRIHAQHLSAARATGYRASTLSFTLCLRAIAIEAVVRPSAIAALVACSSVELLARAVARRDSARGKGELTWSRTGSSRLTLADALSETQPTR